VAGPSIPFARLGPAVAVVVVVGVAGCTSGSGHRAGAPIPSSATATPVVSPTQSPVIDPANQGVDSLNGTATISLSGQAPVRLATTADEPAQLSVDTSRQVRIEVSMHGADGSLLSVAGPATVGRVATDHVSLLLTGPGVVVDNQQGNTCTVTYTKATESAVAGIARCDSDNGTVTVDFSLR
jgi:hypothetical protein